MQWIIGAGLGLFVLNVIAFGIQTGVYQMGGGSPLVCEPDVPKLLCGTPAYPTPDFYELVEPVESQQISTGIGGYLSAAQGLWKMATNAGSLIIALCIIDYEVFQGDPTGQNPAAGYLAIVGMVFTVLGVITCVVILIALASPILGHLF